MTQACRLKGGARVSRERIGCRLQSNTLTAASRNARLPAVRYPNGHSLFMNRRLARRGVTALAVLLGLWIVAFASHSHASDDHDASPQGASHCELCLALPGAAVPPAQVSLPVIDASHCRPAVLAAASIPGESFAGYQSRAPPIS